MLETTPHKPSINMVSILLRPTPAVPLLHLSTSLPSTPSPLTLPHPAYTHPPLAIHIKFYRSPIR